MTRVAATPSLSSPAGGPSTQTSVEVRDLSKWFGQVVAVNGVSLTVCPGVTGLLGPNGAGKSTLMKVLTGQIKASRGSARILDQEPWNNPELNRLLGYCP